MEYAYYGNGNDGKRCFVYRPLWMCLANGLLRLLQFFTKKKYVVYAEHEITYNLEVPASYKVLKYHFGKVLHRYRIPRIEAKQRKDFKKIPVI